MKSRKISLFSLLIVTIFTIPLLNIVNVKAIERNIVNLIISESGESSPPVFDMNDGYMYPGAEINKSFVLKNTSTRKYKIENISLKNFSIKDINGKILDVNNSNDLKLIEEFYQSIECKVSCEGIFSDKVLYSDDIKELINGKTLQTKISILSGNEKKFNVVVSMKTSAGNNMQGLQANFNIAFNAIYINEGTVVDPPVQPPINPPTDPPAQPPIEAQVDPPLQLPIDTQVDPPLQPTTDPITETTKPIDPPIENSDTPGNTGGTDVENPVTEIDSIEGSNSGNTYKELVQTGSPIDTVSLSIIGLIFIGTGVVISFKKKE